MLDSRLTVRRLVTTRRLWGALAIAGIMLAGVSGFGPVHAQDAMAPRQAATEAAGGSEGRSGWRAACRTDVTQYCKGRIGGRAKRQCLEINLTKVSPGCQSSLSERRALRAQTRQSCQADILKLCNTAVGGSAQLKCLQEKVAELTPDCGKAMATLAAGGGSKRTGAGPKN